MSQVLRKSSGTNEDSRTLSYSHNYSTHCCPTPCSFPLTVDWLWQVAACGVVALRKDEAEVSVINSPPSGNLSICLPHLTLLAALEDRALFLVCP